MIGKKGKQTNFLQEQSKVEITTTTQKTDYRDITITGNQEDIENKIHSISKIILCRNFPTDNYQFGIDCKFEHINNINYTQESYKTQATSNTQKSYQANQITTVQLTQIVNHQTIQELIRKVSRNYNENEIKITNKKRTRRSKKKQRNIPDKEINVMYSSARGIKSKVNSLKQILLNKPCEIIALCETHLKQNKKVSIAGFKWIGLNRKDKHAGEIGFLINNNIVKSCFVEPQTSEGIEIMTIRLELKQNKTIIICIYYGKRNQNKK